MTDLVPQEDIERIVGAARREFIHRGRAVSTEQRVYILHSQECLDSGTDLRDCPYSTALDLGIELSRWAGFEDEPMELWVSASTGRLIPLKRVADD